MTNKRKTFSMFCTSCCKQKKNTYTNIHTDTHTLNDTRTNTFTQCVVHLNCQLQRVEQITVK